jgi:hypothetical protein
MWQEDDRRFCYCRHPNNNETDQSRRGGINRLGASFAEIWHYEYFRMKEWPFHVSS